MPALSVIEIRPSLRSIFGLQMQRLILEHFLRKVHDSSSCNIACYMGGPNKKLSYCRETAPQLRMNTEFITHFWLDSQIAE